MKKEDLYKAIGDIDESIIEKSETYIAKKINVRIWAAVAAAVIIMVGVEALFAGINNSLHNKDDGNKSSITDENAGDIRTEIMNDYENNSENDLDEYIDVNELIAENDYKETALKLTKVKINDYNAVYGGVNIVSEKKVVESIGEKIENSTDFYRILGHKDMQYIIKKNDDEVSLWKFESFECNEYPYNDVLKYIYNINSHDDIETITATAGEMDNTDEGEKIREQIGTLTITDQLCIEQFYNIISKMTCYGSDNWDRIDYGANDAGMTDAVKNSRYLSVMCSGGVNIDSLKYTKVSGMFYEYSGIAYKKLSDKNRKIIEDILEMTEKSE